jgi:hypothetical protein
LTATFYPVNLCVPCVEDFALPEKATTCPGL